MIGWVGQDFGGYNASNSLSLDELLNGNGVEGRKYWIWVFLVGIKIDTSK